MKKNPSEAELWLRREASENPRSIAARVEPESVSPIAARMESELPTATPMQRAAWLLTFETEYPDHFKPVIVGDLRKLSGSELLAIANSLTHPKKRS